MITLGDVIPPHEPDHPRRARELLSAYRARRWVNPPVALVWPEETRALSGSHRLAALVEAYGAGTDAEEHVLLVDGLDLIGSMAEDRAGLALLADFRAGETTDYQAVIRAVLPYLPDDAKDALADQLH